LTNQLRPNRLIAVFLDRGGVKHDANRSAKRSRGKGVGELGTNDARVAVRTSDLAPDHADLGATDLLLSPVDIRHLLAKVEVGSGGVIDALDLDQARLRVGSVPATLVAEVATLDI
jgi:hypothetical protein